MKTNIYYFSGSGNSLAVARHIAAELEEANVSSISDVAENEVSDDADRVGMVYPVYMFGLPLIVSRFANNLRVKEGAYVFSVATYGGTPGDANGQLKRLLAKRGIRLAAGFGIKMPGNYTPLYGAPPDDKQKTMFEKENSKAREIAAAVRDEKQSVLERSNMLISAVLSGFVYKMGSSRIPGMDKDFFADEKCDGCGICARVCPVANVELKDGKPSWLGHCEQCMACLQWCPQEAIQLGAKTNGRRRYRHPETMVRDFLRD